MATTAVQVVRVYNNRGKMISTSKHLVGVLNEAKVAYQEKKAELKAARSDSQARKGKTSRSPSPPMLPQRTNTVPADMPYAQQNRPPMDSRGYTDGFYANDGMLGSSSRPATTMPTHPPPYSPTVPAYVTDELQRSRSYEDLYALRPNPQPYHTNHTYDSDYEELPPPLPTRPTRSAPEELKTKMSALQALLLEANAVSSSARSIVKSLEKDPQKMAAVALSLGEISNLLRTMAPGALLSMKGAFPVIVALLISSEFLIAVGVTAGVTVVALGGYKVVKKIKAKRTADKEAKLLLEQGRGTELQGEDAGDADVDIDVEHIQQWRRGISDEDARSLGTSVEEEFITPGAARMLAEGQQQPLQQQQQQQQRQGLLPASTEERLPWVRTPSPNPEKQRASTPFKNLFKRGS